MDGADWTFQWRSGPAGVSFALLQLLSFALLQLLIIQIVFHKNRKCTCTTIIQNSNHKPCNSIKRERHKRGKQKTMAGAPDNIFVYEALWGKIVNPSPLCQLLSDPSGTDLSLVFSSSWPVSDYYTIHFLKAHDISSPFFYFLTFEKADCSIFTLSVGWLTSPLIFQYAILCLFSIF